VNINLDLLKDEILEYLAGEEFLVFRSIPGGLEGHPMVFWDAPGYPDYRAFLHVAKQSGARIILFAHRELTAGEVDDTVEMLQHSTLARDERRSIERSLDGLRSNIGSVCSIELGFAYDGRLYVFELVTDWFSTFMDFLELLEAASGDEEEDEDGPSLGGYFSKN
jgi:hypothetical protein